MTSRTAWARVHVGVTASGDAAGGVDDPSDCGVVPQPTGELDADVEQPLGHHQRGVTRPIAGRNVGPDLSEPVERCEVPPNQLGCVGSLVGVLERRVACPSHLVEVRHVGDGQRADGVAG